MSGTTASPGKALGPATRYLSHHGREVRAGEHWVRMEAEWEM